MNQPARKQLILLVLLVLLVTSIVSSANRTQAVTAFQSEPQAVTTTYTSTDPYIRTELFFGTSRVDLPPVSDDDWRGFLNHVITERFPDGLTVLAADGQFKNSSGDVIKEKSFVVILLYPLQQWKISDHRIEQIRRAYTSAFQQQSVLRVDSPLPVRVSF